MTPITTNTQDTLSCRVLVGAPGSGKTARMLVEIVSEPGRYILAAARQDLVEEHVARLKDLAALRGTAPTLQTIHSAQGMREPVARRIAEALVAYAEDAHVVIAITHEGMLGLGDTVLAGWHIRIDEVPDTVILSGQVCIGASWPTLATYYALEPSDVPGCSLIRPRPDVDAPTFSAIIADVSQDLVSLHRAVANPTRTVLIDVTEWADGAQPGRKVGWWSIWSFDCLAGCASITLTSASYVGSLLQRVMEGSSRITPSLENAAVASRSADPSIHIHYFTQHAGSTSWWQTDEGSRCLVAISRHLESIAFAGFWSCNEAIRNFFWHRFAGATLCAPKQAGSNALRAHTACVMIYSAKAQGGDTSILDVLDLDHNDIRSAREYEDIYQFALRGAIRNADYAGDYDIYIYGRDQAERLRDRLIAQGYGDVALVPVVSAGIMDVARPQSAREPKAAASHTSAAELCEQSRNKERERGRRRRKASRDQHQANGTLRPPGRPRKMRSQRQDKLD